jgi:hypothetical protein
MSELPFTGLPTRATPVDNLKSWRLILRCARCNRKVVLAVADIARQIWILTLIVAQQADIARKYGVACRSVCYRSGMR